MQTMPRRDQPAPRAALAPHPTGLRLTAAQHDGLSFLAEARGVSLSTVIRDAVNDYLEGFESSSGTLLELAELGELVSYDGPTLDDQADDVA